MSNSNLVSYTLISPSKNSPRNDKIRKITIHHAAGNASVETLGKIFADPARKASANYGIGTDGRIALYVDESDRAWTSGSRENDHQAITIEVANDGAGPAWHVSDAAIESLINLCVDICQRNGIEMLNFTGDKSGNLTMHKFFEPTVCPGPYLESKFPFIAKEVNKRLGHTEEYRPSVLEWQKAAIDDGFRFPKYGSDGIWGAECEGVAKKAVVKRRNTYMYPNLTKLVQKVVGVKEDGKCGILTETAIKEYQKKNGLVVDGAVGINTWKRMLGV
jgi:peptidoglycan hydrolase-like protein with peptidoglycan-binding domain